MRSWRGVGGEEKGGEPWLLTSTKWNFTVYKKTKKKNTNKTVYNIHSKPIHTVQRDTYPRNVWIVCCHHWQNVYEGMCFLWFLPFLIKRLFDFSSDFYYFFYYYFFFLWRNCDHIFFFFFFSSYRIHNILSIEMKIWMWECEGKRLAWLVLADSMGECRT